MHLFLVIQYSLVLKERGVPLKPTLRSLLMNLFFISEEVIKELVFARFL